MLVSLVDTLQYDALLGMEFMAAVGGCYETYIEMLKYRRVGPDGLTHRFEVPALCHLSSPPLIAYAFFGGLIHNDARLHDVQRADNDIAIEEEDYGHHTSPHQLVAHKVYYFLKLVTTWKKYG